MISSIIMTNVAICGFVRAAHRCRWETRTLDEVRFADIPIEVRARRAPNARDHTPPNGRRKESTPRLQTVWGAEKSGLPNYESAPFFPS